MFFPPFSSSCFIHCLVFFFVAHQMWTSVSHLRATTAPPASTWRMATSANAPRAGKATLANKVCNNDGFVLL